MVAGVTTSTLGNKVMKGGLVAGGLLGSRFASNAIGLQRGSGMSIGGKIVGGVIVASAINQYVGVGVAADGMLEAAERFLGVTG